MGCVIPLEELSGSYEGLQSSGGRVDDGVIHNYCPFCKCLHTCKQQFYNLQLYTRVLQDFHSGNLLISVELSK